MAVSAPDGFWSPVRETLVKNVVGHLPATPKYDKPERIVPWVTYISRQGGGRRLLTSDHERLVASLQVLAEGGICRFRVVQMETLSTKEQIEVAASSTVRCAYIHVSFGSRPCRL